MTRTGCADVERLGVTRARVPEAAAREVGRTGTMVEGGYVGELFHAPPPLLLLFGPVLVVGMRLRFIKAPRTTRRGSRRCAEVVVMDRDDVDGTGAAIPIGVPLLIVLLLLLLALLLQDASCARKARISCSNAPTLTVELPLVAFMLFAPVDESTGAAWVW